MKLVGKILYEKLIQDEKYIEYCNKYSKEHVIDTNLLKELLETHKDFYCLFLKCFIFLYFKDEIKYLNKNLQNYYYINNRKLFIDDLEIVLKYYYSNYSRCKYAIKKIIVNKLRPKPELKILKLIRVMDIDKCLVPIIDSSQ